MVSGTGVDTHCLTFNYISMISEPKRKHLLHQITFLEHDLKQLKAAVLNDEQPPTKEELQAIRARLLLKNDAVLLALFSCLL